jgi:tight adherence protein B
MVAALPFAIILGAMATVGLLFFSFWGRLIKTLGSLTHIFSYDLERAAMKMHSEQIVVGIVGFAVSVWLFVIALVRPGFTIAGVLLPALIGIAMLVFKQFAHNRAEKRLHDFTEQLEMVLRMMSSGLRVGLGLRQAIVLVTEEVADPARVEFARAIGETMIGVTMNDALEGLAHRMPSNELRMMVDAIKVQSNTGGNLAKLLDHLAATIKARRQIRRKIQTLTGEARAGAIVIGLLPVFVGTFVMLTQPIMREAMIDTTIGHLGFMLFLILEGLGVLSLRMMMAFKI